MSLRGSLQGSILSRGVASGAGVDIPAPDNLDPPVISSFTIADNPIDEDVETTFSWTLGGDAPTSQIVNPGDGSANYTVSPGTTSVAHTYADADTYVATLGVSNSAGSDSDTIPDIVVSVPSSIGFYDWGTFSSMTETRRNSSGASAAGKPVKFKVQFHKGEVTTSRWFDLYRSGVLVATDEWQLGEISTYPDGSMRSAVVRCYGPGTWADGADVQWDLQGKAGSWPTLATNPASDGTAITLVTDDSELVLSLEDITLLGSPYASTTQPAYGAPNLDSELNRSIVVSTHSRKYAAGDVCICWRTWEKMQPPGGGTEDAELWVIWFVEAWLDGSGNLAHLMVEPYLNNGWARVQGMLKGFKLKLMDGATTLRDFATAVTLDATDFEDTNGMKHWTGANRTSTFPYTDFDGRFGTAAKVSGDPPSGYVSGKIYQIAAIYSDGPTHELFQRPRMGFTTYGQFKSGNNFTAQDPGTGGTTYTLTHYNFMCDKQVFPIRDGSGIEFWPVGGASGKIWPNWTRAEKIRRLQTGMMPNATIETVTDRTGQTYSGYDYNSGGKNTTLLPLYNHLNNYTPGATIHHASWFEDGGYWFSGMKHKSECSLFLFNLLNDMGRDVFMRIQLQAAAESAAFLVGINCYENSTSGGVEIAYPICINNGPNKAGTQYTGMGPCRPSAEQRSSTNTEIWRPGLKETAGSTTYDESTAAHWSTTSGTGAHGSKEIVYAEALHCSPGYRELITGLWMRAALQDFTTGGATPQFCSNKVLDGETYYRVAALATTPDSQTRAFVARTSWLGYALSAPDTEPYKAMLQDIAADNVNYLDVAYDDPDVIGGTAKAIGSPTGSRTGGEQAWHLSRVNWGALMLLKRSGINSANYLAFHTAFGRWYFNDPVVGSGPAFHSTGWMGSDALHLVQYFDEAAYQSPDSVAGTQQWMRDAASSVTDGSRTSIALPSRDSHYVRFMTDGATIQYTMPAMDKQDSENFAPNDGDEVAVTHNATQPGEGIGFTLLNPLEWLYLYDKTESAHTILIPKASGNFAAVGDTLTDGSGNTATIIHGGGYTRNIWTVSKPSPSNFVSGTLTCSNGSTYTYGGSIVGRGYSYKLSSTDPASSTTPRTWATASVVDLPPYAMMVIYKTRRTGNQTGGLVQLRTNDGDLLTNQGWLGHIFGPVQAAATMFGKDETGLANTIDALDDFYANVLSGQSFHFHDINDSLGGWSFHYAYPPGST